MCAKGVQYLKTEINNSNGKIPLNVFLLAYNQIYKRCQHLEKKTVDAIIVFNDFNQICFSFIFYKIVKLWWASMTCFGIKTIFLIN